MSKNNGQYVANYLHYKILNESINLLKCLIDVILINRCFFNKVVLHNHIFKTFFSDVQV